MKNANELVAVMRMGQANAYYHLKPVVMSGIVDHLHIVRPLPPEIPGVISGSTYHEVKGKTIVTRLAKVFLKTLSLGMRREVKGFISFYAYPYGLIACLAGMLTRKPVHIGFVGDDWYGHSFAWYGPVLNAIFRRAALITVTGPKMKDEMVERHFPSHRIHHLPHAIDLDRYLDTPPKDRRYDCIYVGDLIPRKRVHDIIAAIHEVKKVKSDLRLLIVGDGPLRSGLESQAESLGLDGTITFAGFQSDPSKFFCDSKIVVISSYREGFPFTLVEGMAAGAVPVSTPVGTIPDIVIHGETGLLFPVGDVSGLAGCILKLLTDEALFGSLRSEVLVKRSEYGFERVAGLWAEWIGRNFYHWTGREGMDY